MGQQFTPHLMLEQSQHIMIVQLSASFKGGRIANLQEVGIKSFKGPQGTPQSRSDSVGQP